MASRCFGYRIAVLTVLTIGLSIVSQPVGMLWHFVEDHLAAHAHTVDGVGLHGPDADAPHHEADHGHVWMPPVAAVIAPRMSRPQPIALLPPLENVSRSTAASFPPYSPPRA